MGKLPDSLKSLPGLNRISDEERQRFILNNADKLRKYVDLPNDAYTQQVEVLYNNQRFKDVFGEDAFKQYRGGEEGYNLRNAMLREKLISDAFEEQYSPFNEDGTRDNQRGLGADYEKYFGQVDPVTGQRMGGMSSNGMLKLLESDYLTPSEFESNFIRKQKEAAESGSHYTPSLGMSGISPLLGTLYSPDPEATNLSFL